MKTDGRKESLARVSPQLARVMRVRQNKPTVEAIHGRLRLVLVRADFIHDGVYVEPLS